MLFVSFPIVLNADFVLTIWLSDVPQYATDFVRWTLFTAMVESLAGPLWMSVQAAGKIRNYQLVVCLFLFSTLPLAIVLLSFGCSPVWVLIGRCGINFVTTLWRAIYLKRKLNFRHGSIFGSCRQCLRC